MEQKHTISLGGHPPKDLIKHKINLILNIIYNSLKFPYNEIGCLLA